MGVGVRVIFVAVTTVLVGILVYLGCVVWPLNLLQPTGLIAAISCSMGWATVCAVFLDNRRGKEEVESSESE